MRTIWQTVMIAGLIAFPGLLRAQEATNQPPLPNIGTVLKKIAERAAQEDDEDAFKQLYTYQRVRVKEIRDGDGELKKRDEKNRFHVPKPETANTDADAADESTARSNDESAKDLAKTGRGKAFEKSDFALSKEMLSRFEFKLVRRESIAGRPTLVIDFHPADRNLPEKSIKDKFINKAAGRVWVDEQDYALVKADLHLAERVNVVGGLVGAVWKFKFKVNRERTDEGFWFVRNSGWHLEGRQVFVNRTIDYHEEKSDVKKYSFPEKAQAGLATREITTQ